MSENNVSYLGLHAKEGWNEKGRYRPWCFTHNNYTDEHVQFWKEFPCEYLVAGFEEGDKCGTPHLQGFFNLKDATTFSALKKKIPKGVHLEPARCPIKAASYCQKTNDFFLQGHLRLDRVSVQTLLVLRKILTPESLYSRSTTPILDSCYDTLELFRSTGIELFGPGPNLLLYYGFMDLQELENLDTHLTALDKKMFTSNPLNGGPNLTVSKHVSSSTITTPQRFLFENYFDFLIAIHMRSTLNAVTSYISTVHTLLLPPTFHQMPYTQIRINSLNYKEESQKS